MLKSHVLYSSREQTNLRRADNHLSARLVVVEVHESPAGGQSFASFSHVHKGLRKSHSVGDVVAAARPLEP